jgi:hypothetical protein
MTVSRTLKLLWCAIVPMALLAACAAPEKHVRIVIVPEQTAEAEARQKRVKVTDLIFKKNAADRIDEHPMFFSRDKLEGHGDGCGENLLRISISRHEEVVWEADTKFEILDITKNTTCHPSDVPRPTEAATPLVPGNPFFGTMPYGSTISAPFEVHSGRARPESLNQVYKIKIRINGQILDPDLICMS